MQIYAFYLSLKQRVLWLDILRIMKLIIVLLTVGLMQVSAHTMAQRVNFPREGATLKNLIEAIQKQTGYRVLYSPDQLDANQRVNRAYADVELTQVMDDLARHFDLAYSIEGKDISLRLTSSETSVRSAVSSSRKEDASSLVLAFPEVRGRIVDSLGNALSGASIRVLEASGRRTALQTSTDREGSFVLRNVPEDAQLEISFVGYMIRRVAAAAELGQVLLTAVPEALEEVEVMVNTGYQTLPKERATGSFEVLNSEVLEKTVSSDLLSRLNNFTTGTYFNTNRDRINLVGIPATKELSIHGVSTLSTKAGNTNAPLIILDNFPYEGDINSINPNDIESVTVLKDAAASSIWGAKAGNGVIVMRSKQSKYEQKSQIKFSSDFMIHNKPDFFQHKTISTRDYIGVERDLFGRGFYTSFETNPAKPVLSPVVELLIRHRQKELTDEQLDSEIAQYYDQDVRHDIKKYMYNNSLLQRYNLNIDGGGYTYKYIIGMGYDQSNASLKGFNNDRLTFRIDNTYKLSDKLELQARVRWISTVNTAPVGGSAYSDAGFPLPYISLVDANGEPTTIPYGYRSPFIAEVTQQGKLLDWTYNPIRELQNGENRGRRGEVLLNGALTYSVLNWLNLQLHYQFNRATDNQDKFYSVDSYYTRNLINRGTNLTSGKPVYNFPFGGILDQSVAERRYQSGRIQSNLNKKWNAFAFSGVLGMEIQNSVSNSDGAIKYGYDPILKNSIYNLDFTKTFPIYGNLGSTDRIPTNVKNMEEYIQNFLSFYSNASLTFRDRYIVSGSARRDASNVFGVETNNKWSPLWSSGFAWLLHNEEFVLHDWINYLKLRTSFGYSGNINTRMSGKTVFVYSSTNVADVDYPSGGVTSPPNPLLRWEKVGKVNLGVDFAFFHSRFSGSLDVYQKNTKDLISPVPLDPTTGFGSLDMNVARTKSLGLDLNLQYRADFRWFDWNTNLLFSYNDNWVTDSYTEYGNPTLLVNTGFSAFSIKGMQIHPAYSYRWGGLDPNDGNARGYLNGELSKDYQKIMSNATKLEDLVYHGSAKPLLFGAYHNTITRGNLSFSATLSYRFLYYFRRAGLDYTKLYYSGDGHIDYYKRWQNPGDEKNTHVPVFQYPISNANTFYQKTEVLMEKGDHVRLENVRVSYQTKWLPLKVRNLGLYAQATNLGVIWKANKLGLDPQVEGGIPIPMTFALGLNVNL